MSYNLHSCAGGDIHITENPTLDEINLAIDDLVPKEFHFITLESETPIDNCIFIQTLMPEYKYESEDEEIVIDYLIEARFEYGDYHKQYLTFNEDINEVEKMFSAFLTGVIPDITGWEDITDT